MEVANRGRDFNTWNYFLFGIDSYYFSLVSLVEQDVQHLVDLVDHFGLPSMPKRKTIEKVLKKPIKEGDCKERLLRTYKYASIIFLSLMSNLLFVGETTTYTI